MFPEVFAYPVSRQEMQLSSFFDTSERASAKVQPKCAPSSHQYAFGAAPKVAQSGGVHGSGGSASAVSAVDIENDSSCAAAAAANAGTSRQPMLPSPRRVVKLTVTPDVSAGVTCVCIALNTVLCMLVSEGVTPVLATLWGSFLSLWLLVTVLQLVTHSVYLCTTLGLVLSSLHLAVVASSVVLIPRSLFAHWLWLAPCLCIVAVAYQSYMFCLVFAQHLHKPWLYASIAGALALLPMTQLAQIVVVDDDTRLSCCLWSAVSVSIIYGLAFANNRGAVTVDVTIGANPTRPQKE